MFEKEAKDYCLKRTGYGQDEFHGRKLRQAYQSGAEFGYNKAFVEADKNLKAIVADFNKANEWHKPSEKLPERCSLVLAYAFDDTEPSLYKFVTNDQWEWMPRRIAFLSNDRIRLWKEIVLPKEIKEK